MWGRIFHVGRVLHVGQGFACRQGFACEVRDVAKGKGALHEKMSALLFHGWAHRFAGC